MCCLYCYSIRRSPSFKASCPSHWRWWVWTDFPVNLAESTHQCSPHTSNIYTYINRPSILILNGIDKLPSWRKSIGLHSYMCTRTCVCVKGPRACLCAWWSITRCCQESNFFLSQMCFFIMTNWHEPCLEIQHLPMRSRWFYLGHFFHFNIMKS